MRAQDCSNVFDTFAQRGLWCERTLVSFRRTEHNHRDSLAVDKITPTRNVSRRAIVTLADLSCRIAAFDERCPAARTMRADPAEALPFNLIGRATKRIDFGLERAR